MVRTYTDTCELSGRKLSFESGRPWARVDDSEVIPYTKDRKAAMINIADIHAREVLLEATAEERVLEHRRQGGGHAHRQREGCLDIGRD